MINLSELTIDDIDTAYQEERYSSEQLVAAYLYRIDHPDNKINAIAVVNPLAPYRRMKSYEETGVLPVPGILII